MESSKSLTNERHHSTKPKKSVFSNFFAYSKTHERKNLRSVSTNVLIKREKKYVQYSPNVDIISSNVKNCFTQTSKTILELAKIETGDLSPDSLSASPRSKDGSSSYRSSSQMNQKTYRLSRPSDGSISFARKNSIFDYLCRSDKSEGSSIDGAHLNSPAYPDGMLTETFLGKKGDNQKSTSKSGNIAMNRSRFLQQTSPLRNLCDHFQADSEIKISPRRGLINIPTFNMNFQGSNRLSRFKVKSVANVKHIEKQIQPVKYYSQNIFPHVNEKKETGSQRKLSPRTRRLQRRSNSFMNPTISSTIKNQTPVVESTRNLMSPIRRGRSTSPKKQTCEEEITKKVPYIDQSATNINSNSSATQDTCVEVDSVSTDGNLCDENLLRINLDFQLDTASGSTCSAVRARNDAVICAALSKVRDSDWNVALKGLAEIVAISQQVEVEYLLPHMPVINQRLLDLLRSPRSHVCRTACQAAGHLFEFIRDTRRPEFDDIVELLLFKTADSNKFIRQDANLSLDCMVTHIAAFHAVRALCAKGPTHKNQLVRTATVRLLICVAVIASPDSLFNPNNSEVTRKKLILNMAKFIGDKNYETRKFGDRLYRVLSKDSRFDLYMKKYLDKDAIVQMKKQIKLMHQKK